MQASLRAGADVVAFSGDKLFGGPQAGIIAGRRDLVDTMRHHPLMRALRVDKLTYAALEATLVEHVRGRAAETVPVIRMLSMKVDEIGARATGIARQLTECDARIDIIDGFSAIGGGSAPGERLPTRLIAIDASRCPPTRCSRKLREHDPPVIARIEQDRVVFDLRTVPPDQDLTLASAIRRCLADARSRAASPLPRARGRGNRVLGIKVTPLPWERGRGEGWLLTLRGVERARRIDA